MRWVRNSFKFGAEKRGMPMAGRWCSALALAMLAAAMALASAAGAQGLAPADQKAVVEDAQVAAILKAASGAATIDEATARKFGPLLFQDGLLTANERDLLLELFSNGSGKVTITPPDGDAFEVPPLSRQARAFLSLVTPPSLASLWLQGPAQMKTLVDITVLDPVITSQITAFIRQRLALVWMNSTISNGYKPIRDDLSAAVRQLQQTDPDTERRGRALVFDAVRQLERANSNSIPKYLYDYLGAN